MKDPKPLVSILLPVHNGSRYLKDCVESLKHQTYKNIEIVIIDDKSFDSSYKFLKIAKKRDKRIRLYRNVKRYGIVLTLNRLIKKAKGEYVGFLDPADILHKDRIRRQIKYFLLNPQVLALGTQCVFVNKRNIKIERSNFPRLNSTIYSTSPLQGISMQFETVLINKNLLPKDILRFEENSRPFIYSNLLIKLIPFGKFENLGGFLHRHRRNPETYLSDLKGNILSLLKFWLKSSTIHDYQPSLRSLFFSIIKPSFMLPK